MPIWDVERPLEKYPKAYRTALENAPQSAIVEVRNSQDWIRKAQKKWNAFLGSVRHQGGGFEQVLETWCPRSRIGTTKTDREVWFTLEIRFDKAESKDILNIALDGLKRGRKL